MMLLFLLSLTNEENQEKVEYLFTRFHDDVIRYAKFKLRGMKTPGFDAEDVVQEAYIKVIKYLDRIDFSVGDRSLKSYLFSVIDNQTKDMLTKVKPEECLDDYSDTLESDDDFFENLHKKEDQNAVREAIKQLPLIYTITLRYRFYTEMSIKDISDFMDVPENTVKSRIKRGKQMLSDILQGSDMV